MSGAMGPRTRSRMSEREATRDLFQVHYRSLVGLALLLVDERDAAEDVVQGAFAALYRHSRRLRDPEAALAYLHLSVVTASRSTLRRRVQRARVPSGPRGRAALAEALAALPGRQREVIVLRDYLGLPEGQIAEWLGLSTSSVKQHAFRAAASLHERLGVS